jgi:class 3 adenylate cyclase
MTQGHSDAARKHFEDALDRHIATRNRPWAARTCVSLAKLLMDSAGPDEISRARSLLRTALETAGELGMSGVLQEARDAYVRLEPAVRPELRNAPADYTTILFTDLVSSTELMERIGDDRAHEVMRAHHRMLRKQIASYGGEEMRFQGDGFMVTFRSSRIAVACAVAIQTEVAAYSRTHSEASLHVRAGIHAGMPIVEDGELHGRSVVLAARIADAAGPGEVLVSSRVRELIGDREVLFAPARSITLKGFDGAHTVHPVVWG